MLEVWCLDLCMEGRESTNIPIFTFSNPLFQVGEGDFEKLEGLMKEMRESGFQIQGYT